MDQQCTDFGLLIYTASNWTNQRGKLSNVLLQFAWGAHCMFMLPSCSIFFVPDFCLAMAPIIRSFTVEFKLSVLGWYKANEKSTRLTAKHIDLAPKRVREWLGIEKQLRQVKGEGRRNRTICVNRQPLLPMLDAAILDYPTR
eukprot:scpid40807/ scgid15668/ 